MLNEQLTVKKMATRSFSAVESANPAQSRLERHIDVWTTFNTGKLIPFAVSEIYPGDTVNVTASFALRMSTLIAPVMDRAFLDLYAVFVP